MLLKSITRIAFQDLPGWGADDFEGLKEAFIESLQRMKSLEKVKIADRFYDFTPFLHALKNNDLTPSLLEKHLVPYKIEDSGGNLFTGYFEPQINAAYTPTKTFCFPIYERPDDLLYIGNLGKFNKHLSGERLAGIVQGGELVPYPARSDIYQGAIDGKAKILAWTDNLVDFYFLQVQGSGVLKLDGEAAQRIGYSATNGRAYKSIGKHLWEQSLISKNQYHMAGIKAYLNGLEPDLLKETLSINPSYIFFEKRQGKAPIGSHKLELIPGRSLAVDPKYVPLGLPLWLNCEHPKEGSLQKLMFAHDTGAGIKGPNRGDYFWGTGDENGERAGVMKSRGVYTLLLPQE